MAFIAVSLQIFFFFFFYRTVPWAVFFEPYEFSQSFDAKETSCHFIYLLQVSKQSLQSLILYIFLMI